MRYPERLAITLDHAVPAPSTLHAANHVTGRRDGLDGGTMPCWGRVLVRRWPGGEGPAALQTWKLAKYLEFVQVAASPERFAAAPPGK